VGDFLMANALYATLEAIEVAPILQKTQKIPLYGGAESFYYHKLGLFN
jgi:hypothetical protein